MDSKKSDLTASEDLPPRSASPAPALMTSSSSIEVIDKEPGEVTEEHHSTVTDGSDSEEDFEQYDGEGLDSDAEEGEEEYDPVPVQYRPMRLMASDPPAAHLVTLPSLDPSLEEHVFDEHVDPENPADRDKRFTSALLAVARTYTAAGKTTSLAASAVELIMAAQALIYLAKDASSAVEAIYEGFIKVKDRLQDFFHSSDDPEYKNEDVSVALVPTTSISGYSPFQKVVALSALPWVDVKLMVSFLSEIDTSDLFDLDTRLRLLTTFGYMCQETRPPFSQSTRFDALGSYVNPYSDGVTIEFNDIRDTLTCRALPGLEKDVESKIRRCHISLAQVIGKLQKPVTADKPAFFTRDTFESYYALTWV